MSDTLAGDSGGILTIHRGRMTTDEPLPAIAAGSLSERQAQFREAEVAHEQVIAKYQADVAAVNAAREARARSATAADAAAERLRQVRALLAHDLVDASAAPETMLQLDRANAALSVLQSRMAASNGRRGTLLVVEQEGPLGDVQVRELDAIRRTAAQLDTDLRTVRGEVRRLQAARSAPGIPLVPPTAHVASLIAEALTPAPMLRPSKVAALLGRVA